MLLPILKPGAIIDLVAPAGRPPGDLVALLKSAKAYVATMGWQLRVPDQLFEAMPIYANTDANRFECLHQALIAQDSDAIWCIRGGYGSARLIPRLLTIDQPKRLKWFIGASDITALLCFFQQKWGWPVLHGPTLAGLVRGESLEGAQIQKLLSGQMRSNTIQLTPLNTLANSAVIRDTTVIGGNLTIVQSSIGTNWQISLANKIALLEEVNELPYRVDRILNHLIQAGCFLNARAIVLGAFITKPEHMSLMHTVLKDFAHAQSCPVFQAECIGHTPHNPAIILGNPAEIISGQLTIHT